jgi:hypothetical protein
MYLYHTPASLHFAPDLENRKYLRVSARFLKAELSGDSPVTSHPSPIFGHHSQPVHSV